MAEDQINSQTHCQFCGTPITVHQGEEGTGSVVSKYWQLKEVFEELLLDKLNSLVIAGMPQADVLKIRNEWMSKAGLK